MALLLALLLAGCVAPAPSDAAYRGKALRTANDAASALASAHLGLEAVTSGRASLPYASVVVRDAEDALDSVQSTFASVQPPTPTSDALRAELEDLLGQGADAVSSARIAVRRGEADRLRELLGPLDGAAQGLQQFSERHR